MDTKKLAKIIKVIVEHEIKKQLPMLIEEGVKKQLKKQTPVIIEEVEREIDPFSLANNILDESRIDETLETPVKTKKHFTSNKVLNEILNNTKPFNSKQRGTTTETLSFGTNLAQGGKEAINQVAAGQMGRRVASDNGSSNKSGGMGIKTGVPGLDRILNRDNSELVSKFKTR